MMRGKDVEKLFFGLLKTGKELFEKNELAPEIYFGLLEAGKELLEEKLAPALNKRITNINVKIIYGEDYEITLTLSDGSRVIITSPHEVKVKELRKYAGYA